MLTTTQKAPILLGETNQTITGGQYAATSSDPAVANFEGGHPDAFYLRGISIGLTDVTLVRGGSPATHTVSVIQSPFDWSLGAAV